MIDMKYKRIASFALICALIFNINMGVSAFSTPILVIENISTMGAMRAGETFRVDVTVRNTTASPLDRVFVSAEFASPSVTLESNRNSLERIVGPHALATFSFYYRATRAGVAQIRFAVSQNIITTGTPTDINIHVHLSEITVLVHEAPEEPEPPEIVEPLHRFDVIAEMYNPVSRRISVGQEIRMGFRIANLNEISRNVRIAISDVPGLRATALRSHHLGDMQPGEVAFVEFSFIATEDAADGLNEFELVITADNGRRREHSIGITVDNPEVPPEEIMPNLAFSNIRLPENISRGESFTLSAVITNTGAEARNIDVKLALPTGISITGRDIIQIASLPRGASQAISFELIVEDSARDHANRITLNAEALNSEGDEVRAVPYHTGINVLPEEDEPPAQFAITSVNIPANINMGDTFTVEITAANTGEAELRNIRLAAESPNGILNQSAEQTTIASLQPGETHIFRIEYEVSPQASPGFQAFRAEMRTTAAGGATAGAGAGTTIDRHFGTLLNAPDMPALRIERVSAPSSVRPNANFNVEVEIRNTGDAEARDVSLTLTPPATGIFATSRNVFLIESIGAGETVTRSVAFSVSPATTAPNGYVPINVTLAHGGETVDQRPSGTNVINPPPPPEDEEPGRLEMPVVIISRFSYESITPEVPEVQEMPGGFEFGGESTDFFGNFDTSDFDTFDDESGAVYELQGRIVVGGGAPPPPRPMPGGGDMMPMPGGGRTPTAAQHHPDAIVAGQSFIFTVELLNTHRQVAVRDLTITITSATTAGATGGGGVVFNPVRGANTFFFERLEPGQTIEQSIELNVRADAPPDSHGLVIRMTYRNDDATVAPVTSEQIINIPVRQELRFSVAELPMIAPVELGDEAFVPVSFGNLGRSMIYNVLVRVVGDGFFSLEGNFPAGNLEPGRPFTSRDFFLMTTQGGFLSGQFIFSYEDAEGNVYEEAHPFFFQVMGGDMEGGMEWPGERWPPEEGEDGEFVFDPETGQMVWMPGGMPGEEEQPGLLMWIIIGAGALVLIAGVIIIIVAVRKRRAGKAEEDDDAAE